MIACARLTTSTETVLLERSNNKPLRITESHQEWPGPFNHLPNPKADFSALHEHLLAPYNEENLTVRS